MSPIDRHQRMTELFNRAVALRTEARESFLRAECGEDAGLLGDLLRLLRAEEVPTVEAGAAVGAAAAKVVDGLREGPGTRIGSYKLLEQIGEGGFGVVFLAEQQTPVVRRVALKVIKLGMDTRAVIARFEAERQALAMMDHPNIARVLDAGATEGGRPYFVMELVRGDPITNYCDKNNLPIPERLELLQQVCHAVQHAHQKGIIHRDIKPSNVLVTMADGRPVPKVIDFGIAKATSARLTEKTLFTEHRCLIGTPAYMSPEQAEMSGVDIDTRSDIYSLGVLMYELLTGALPFDPERLRSAAFGEIQRIIREEEPAKPSTRLSTLDALPSVAAQRHTEPTSLNRLVRGDLDWIVMRCLEKDRTRRYETASGLAEEIRRHLSHEPVVAAPPSRTYRFRKLVNRNKGLFAAASAVAVSLLLGLVFSTIGFVAASRARAREAEQRTLAETRQHEAQTAAESSQAITAFLTEDLLASADPHVAREREITVAEVLENAARDIENKFTDKPLVEAAIRATLGDVYRSLGKYPSAEAHLSRSLELRQSLLGAEHLETLDSLSQLASLYREQGLYDEAEALTKKTLEQRRRLLGDEHPVTLTERNNLGLVYYYQGRYGEAEAIIKPVVEAAERVRGAEHPDTLSEIDNLALIYGAQSRYAEAEPLCRRVLEVRRRVLGEDHPVTLATLDNLATLLFNLDRLAEAESLSVRAVAGLRSALGSQHPSTLTAIHALAANYWKQGRYVEAESLFVESLEGRRRALGESHSTTLFSMMNLAALYWEQGRREDAVSLLERVLEQQRAELGNERPATLASIHNLGHYYKELGRYEQAEPLCRESYETRLRLLGPDNDETLLSAHNLAALYRTLGRLDEAEPLCLDTLERARRVVGDGHTLTAKAMQNLVLLYHATGRLDEAEALAREAVAIGRMLLGDEHAQVAISLNNLASLLQAKGDYAGAERLYREALANLRKVHGDEHPHVATALHNLASVLHDQTNYAAAEPLFREALALRRKLLGNEHPDVATGLSNLGRLLTDTRNYAAAEPLFREALAIRGQAFADDHPQVWLRYTAMSLLGGALLGQGETRLDTDPGAAAARFAEAEPLLLEGYKGMKDDPRVPKPTADADRKREALNRIVKLYETWNALAPNSGKDQKAAAWRAELEKLPGP